MNRDDLATKKNLEDLGETLKSEIKAAEERIDGKLQDTVVTLLKFIEQEGQKTCQHFDSVAENMFQDLSGANADHLAMHDNKITSHEQRITKLELASGLR